MNPLPHIYGPATIDPEVTKVCKVCGEAKPVFDFPMNGGGHRRPDCKLCHAARISEWQKATLPARLKSHVRWSRRIRMEALVHYSDGDKPQCACCLETNPVFLTIDHVNGGGSKHRKEIKNSDFPAWLKRNGYPDGYQILCYNCNAAKRAGKQCPHQMEHGDGVRVVPPAFVDSSVVLGQGSIVWRFTTICEGTRIGENTVIGSGCWIGRNCQIGNGVRINHGTFIPHGTIIEDFVFFGPNVTLTDDKHPRAGNVNYAAQPPIIRARASIGAAAVVLPGVEIGEDCMVGAGAVVTKSVRHNDTVVGLPARTRTPTPYNGWPGTTNKEH